MGQAFELAYERFQQAKDVSDMFVTEMKKVIELIIETSNFHCLTTDKSTKREGGLCQKIRSNAQKDFF